MRIRTAVVLPAPLGPSRPSTVPGRHGEVDAGERLDVAEALGEALDPDGGGGEGVMAAMVAEIIERSQQSFGINR